MDNTELAEQLIDACVVKGVKLATAESCTGGLIAAVLTGVPGASAVVERGFVTYSNEAKQEMLGVPEDLISTHGAVSEPVAQAMAVGALERSRGDVTLSVTGIAGPEGGSEEKPVGLVWFGIAGPGEASRTFHHEFDGDRSEIRTQAVTAAMQAALEHLSV